MKYIKLTQHGFGHVVALGLVVVSVGVIGTYLLVSSHADSVCSSTSTQNGVTVTSTSCNSSTCIINGVVSQPSACAAHSTPIPPVISKTPVTVPRAFVGTVTADGCVTSSAPIGDVGCSITVDSTKVVAIVHGNINTPTWGKLEGFTATTNITGKRVLVLAVPQTQANFYSLSSVASYVKVLP
jgi:hypothetical protein